MEDKTVKDALTVGQKAIEEMSPGLGTIGSYVLFLNRPKKDPANREQDAVSKYAV